MEEIDNINDNDVNNSNNSNNSNKIRVVLIFIIVALIGFMILMLLTKNEEESSNTNNETIEPIKNETIEPIKNETVEPIKNETIVSDDLPYGTYRYNGNKTSYSKDEKALITKLNMYVSKVSAGLNLDNDNGNGKYESVLSKNRTNYNCSIDNEGVCITRFERNTKLTGSDLEIETVLYNTIMYLYEYKNDVFKKDKLGNEALKKLFSEDEYSDDMEELLNKNKGHIISAKEVINYANKFYDLKLSEDAYSKIKFLKNQGQTDIQGIFLTKFNNEDVYYVYLVGEADFAPDENEVISTYYKLEKDDSNIYLYYKAIYNYLNGYVEELNDDVIIITKYDGSDKIEVENRDKLYEKYPEYFTDYKLTFKDNGDETYTFVSNEPITK